MQIDINSKAAHLQLVVRKCNCEKLIYPSLKFIDSSKIIDSLAGIGLTRMESAVTTFVEAPQSMNFQRKCRVTRTGSAVTTSLALPKSTIFYLKYSLTRGNHLFGTSKISDFLAEI